MSYELQVHALSPTRPSVAEVVARAGESGVAVELVSCRLENGDVVASGAGAARDWTRLDLRSAGAEQVGFSVSLADDREERLEGFRADRAAGESVPDDVLQAAAVYLVELDAAALDAAAVDAEVADDAREDGLAGAPVEAAAGFVVTAWAVAALTEAIVFDPQEEFFADAESFWALVMDEDALASAGPEP